LSFRAARVPAGHLPDGISCAAAKDVLRRVAIGMLRMAAANALGARLGDAILRGDLSLTFLPGTSVVPAAPADIPLTFRSGTLVWNGLFGTRARHCDRAWSKQAGLVGSVCLALESPRTSSKTQLLIGT
jgi:hypothetical protein